MVEDFKEKSKIENGANTQEVGLQYQDDIIVGEFVDRDRATLREEYEARMREVLKEKFVPYEGA